MKASEIRDLSPAERQHKENDLIESLFNLRFQHGIGQLENPQTIKYTKRDIARVKTIIKESFVNNKTEKK